MTDAPADLRDAVAALARLREVPAAVDRAREACTQLRWHQALRRRIPEAASESRVRGATASALLEGAEPAGSQGTVHLVRDLVRGAVPWEERAGDPVRDLLAGVTRCTLATETLGAAHLRAPAQVLALLHTSATAGLLPDDQLGRPRRDGEVCRELAELPSAPGAAEVAERLAAVHRLIASVPDGGVPVLVVAAVVHAEIVAARPFVLGNAVVARAVERTLLRVGGVDPTGVAVPELGHADKVGADYRGALGAYCAGGSEGVRLWLLHCCEAVERGAAEGLRIADAVLAGRL